MPSRGGKEAVQSPRAIPPVQPAVRGVEMPGRRSKSIILRARDWLAAIASNRGSASAHITTWYRLLAGQHKICPKHTRASQDLRYLLVLYYTYIMVARAKVAPLSTPPLLQERQLKLSPPSLRFFFATAEPHHLARHRHTSPTFSPRPRHVILSRSLDDLVTYHVLLHTMTPQEASIAAATACECPRAQHLNRALPHRRHHAAQNLIAPRQTMPS